MWSMFTSLAFAEAPGHWHPVDLAPHSKLYADTSARLRDLLSRREAEGQALADAILQYEEALDLLGPEAPASERAHQAALEDSFRTLRDEVQVFADTLVTDYDAAFRGAIARAAGPDFAALQECESTVPAAPTLPGMPSPTEPNPECEGPDLNASLAAKSDADPQLKAELDAIVERTWPRMAIDPQPRPVLGGEPRWISVRALVAGVAGAALDGIASSDALARMELSSEAVEASADPAKFQALREKVEQIDQQTAASRATLGAPILAASREVLAKLEGPPVGWCVYPAALGGCVGEEAPAVIGTLAGNKKVRKAAEKAGGR